MSRLIILPAIITALLIKDVLSSGVFEFRLQKFQNTLGRDIVGKCCSSTNSVQDSSADLRCSGECLTSFRVCLKHYQVLVDTDSPCTYGDVYTPVLGDKLIEQEYTLKFPFHFKWAGTFSLIVEAWHDYNSTTPGGKRLLARHTQQQNVHVGQNFVPASYTNHHTSLHFEYRVTCLPHYYGTGCEVLCRPRDDSFGHFVCTQDGLPKCLPGWEGQYCTKPRCLPGCDAEHGHCSRPGECIGQESRSFDIAANQNMIFDFTDVASVDNWTEMSDTVRTVGMSKAAIVLQKTQVFQRAVFFSLLNPQPNGAGFAGVRAVGNLDLSRYQALKLRARAQGPNTHYEMVLRHRGEDQEPFPTYENFFTAPTGDFGEVELKLSDFVPYYRGRQVPDADPLDAARVTSLGLQVYGGVYSPTKQVGPGSLEIDWIGGVPSAH